MDKLSDVATLTSSGRRIVSDDRIPDNRLPLYTPDNQGCRIQISTQHFILILDISASKSASLNVIYRMYYSRPGGTCDSENTGSDLRSWDVRKILIYTTNIYFELCVGPWTTEHTCVNVHSAAKEMSRVLLRCHSGSRHDAEMSPRSPVP